MNVIEIPTLGKRVEYPSCWEELNREQLLFIMRNSLLLTSGDISMLDFQVLVLYNLLGIRRKWKHNKRDRNLTQEHFNKKYCNIARAAETVDFMFTRRDGTLIFDFNCVINFLPEIRIKRKTFYGPADALFNITFEEYQVACDYNRRFIASREESDLNTLCAVLYRPGRNGDIGNDRREEFNPHLSVKRAELFKRVHFEVKYTILSWFSACDNYLKTGDIEIEGRIVSFAALFRKETNENEVETDTNLGLTGIMMAIADNGTFGSLEQVKRTNLYTVMLRVYLWHLENERLKKLYKNDKSE